jgi:polar amino acid transport system substrate-binding protein
MMDLESGAVDAVAMDKFVALDQINGKEDTYTVLDYEISSEQYAVGFASGNTELRDQVNEILLEMNEDGTFAEISEKWFGTDVSILGK